MGDLQGEIAYLLRVAGQEVAVVVGSWKGFEKAKGKRKKGHGVADAWLSPGFMHPWLIFWVNRGQKPFSTCCADSIVFHFVGRPNFFYNHPVVIYGKPGFQHGALFLKDRKINLAQTSLHSCYSQIEVLLVKPVNSAVSSIAEDVN